MPTLVTPTRYDREFLDRIRAEANRSLMELLIARSRWNRCMNFHHVAGEVNEVVTTLRPMDLVFLGSADEFSIKFERVTGDMEFTGDQYSLLALSSGAGDMHGMDRQIVAQMAMAMSGYIDNCIISAIEKTPDSNECVKHIDVDDIAYEVTTFLDANPEDAFTVAVPSQIKTAIESTIHRVNKVYGFDAQAATVPEDNYSGFVVCARRNMGLGHIYLRRPSPNTLFGWKTDEAGGIKELNTAVDACGHVSVWHETDQIRIWRYSKKFKASRTIIMPSKDSSGPTHKSETGTGRRLIFE